MKKITFLLLILAFFASCETLGIRQDEPEKEPEYVFTANESMKYRLQLQIDYSGKVLGFGEEGTLNINGDVNVHCSSVSAEGYRLLVSTSSMQVTGGSAAIRNEVKKAFQGRMNFAMTKKGDITSEYTPISSNDALLLETFVLPVVSGSSGSGTVNYTQDPISVSMDITAKEDRGSSSIKWEKIAKLTDRKNNSSMGTINIVQQFSITKSRLSECSYEGNVTLNVPAQSGGFTVNVPVKTSFEGRLTI